MPRRPWRYGLLLMLALCLALAGCDDDDGGLDAVDDATPDTEGDAPDPDVDPDAVDPDAVDPDAVDPDVVDPDVVDPDAVDPDATDADATDTDAVEPPPMAWPEGVQVIELDGNGYANVTASFADGMTLASMDWAHTIGCWDDPLEDEFFQSNHVAFGLAAPLENWTDLTVTVTPVDPSMEVNPYLIVEGAAQFDVPPAITQAPYCVRPLQLGPNVATSVSYRIHREGPNNIFIGVANRGRWNADDTGQFTVEVQATAIPQGPERCYAELEEPGKFAPHVNLISLDAEGRYVAHDTMLGGARMCDLTFLNDQFCVPTTQFDFFRGGHKLYALDTAASAESFVTVTVTPDPGVDVNLYGAWMGEGNYYVPPHLIAGGCEASLDPTGPNPGEVESFSVFTGNGAKNILFGVSGPQGTAPDSGYTITVESVSTSTDNCSEADYTAVQGLTGWPTSVQTIAVTGGTGQATGNLAEGTALCTLDWASTSQLACFPATENPHFAGKTQVFALETPPPPGSYVKWTVTPEPDVDVSIFGYRTGTDSYYVPPFVPSAVNCEASYPLAVGTAPDPGVIEVIEFYNPGNNQYNYFLGVAGYEGGVHEGAYTVDVEVVQPPPPHCPESLPGSTYATWPGHVTRIALDANGQATGQGNLSQGSCVNLDFASTSQVACFPATQNDRFEGNHVFYALDEPIPPRSEVHITVTPDPSVEVSLYGIQAGTTSYPVPPAIYTAICESSLSYTGANPGVAETISFYNPSDVNLYNIFFAVAGDDATGTQGAYAIDVELVTGVEHCPESLPGESNLADWPASVTQAAFDANGDWSTTGNLSSGSCLHLDWATNSSVACFPETQFDRYQGNHVMYALDQVMPPDSVLTIVVDPEPNVEVSLWGLQLGSTEFRLPPAIPSAICESSLSYTGANPGQPETITFYNPSATSTYNILFGVAGDEDTGTSGAYTISAHLSQGVTHCEGSLPGSSYSAWPSSVKKVALDAAGTASITGDISSGACTNLDWAASSQTACFPETIFSDFEGNHVFYALDQPLEPNKTVTITATSTGGTPISLYGYTIGTESFYVPPYTPITVACEYGLPTANTASIQLSTVNNPYNVFFAVAGDTAATSGGYTIHVVTAP